MSVNRKARCLSTNELNSSISSLKSKKRKKQKPCLANPLTLNNNPNPKSFSIEVRKLLRNVLPQIDKKPQIPYDQIKNIPFTKRKELRYQIRKAKNLPTSDQSVLKYFLFGANRVTRYLEKETLAAVILNSEHGKIFDMVTHIKTMCEQTRTAYVNCDNLEEITNNCLHLKQCLAIGIREPSDSSGGDNGNLIALIEWIRSNSNIKPNKECLAPLSLQSSSSPSSSPSLLNQTEHKLLSLTLIEPTVQLLQRSDLKRTFEIPVIDVSIESDPKPRLSQAPPQPVRPPLTAVTAVTAAVSQTKEPETTQPKFQLPFQLFNPKPQQTKTVSISSPFFKPIKMKFVPDKTDDGTGTTGTDNKTPPNKKRKKK